MDVRDILTGSGIPYKETRFLKPPRTTYAIFNDAYERRGGDSINLVNQHDVTIELYEYAPDNVSEQAIEAQIDLAGYAFIKQPRYWLEQEQLYQVVYDFTYTLKEV